MDAEAIVVLKIILENAAQRVITEDDDPIQTLAADASVEPLRVWILPEAARSGQRLFDSHVSYAWFFKKFRQVRLVGLDVRTMYFPTVDFATATRALPVRP